LRFDPNAYERLVPFSEFGATRMKIEGFFAPLRMTTRTGNSKSDGVVAG
jgi:hypothetical protein